MTLLKGGLIYHPIERQINDKYLKRGVKTRIKRKIGSILNDSASKRKQNDTEINIKERDRLVRKSIGYHHFNTYAFALLKKQYPENSIWYSEHFKQIMNYLLKEEYIKGLLDNEFGYPYNAPGFEVPFSLSVLSNFRDQDLLTYSKYWVNEQFKCCFNPKTQMMSENTEDALTLTARLYELCRLRDTILSKIEVSV